jgi:hypothetical protein
MHVAVPAGGGVQDAAERFEMIALLGEEHEQLVVTIALLNVLLCTAADVVVVLPGLLCHPWFKRQQHEQQTA